MIGALASQPASSEITGSSCHVVVMYNVPTRIVGRELDAVKAKGYWLCLFTGFRTFPRALITGQEDIWRRYYFSDGSLYPLTIQDEALRLMSKRIGHLARCLS